MMWMHQKIRLADPWILRRDLSNFKVSTSPSHFIAAELQVSVFFPDPCCIKGNKGEYRQYKLVA